ncbi:hypothetical protein HY967_02835 [Candidatus Jorgensenbacteria bacterium]|nr:hypothetical protein [Candidatus Jorgensenbacteria bacterium]
MTKKCYEHHTLRALSCSENGELGVDEQGYPEEPTKKRIKEFTSGIGVRPFLLTQMHVKRTKRGVRITQKIL